MKYIKFSTVMLMLCMLSSDISFGQGWGVPEIIMYNDSTGAIFENNVKQWGWRFWRQGRLVAMKDYVNDTINGLVSTFYISGTKKYEAEFKNGVRNGELRKYSPKLELIYTAYYVNDTLHGKVVEYYPSGNKKLELEYNQGRLEGKGYAYYENGKMLAEGEFENGLRSGTYRFYSEKGMYVEEKFTNGYISANRRSLSSKGELLFESYPDESRLFYNKGFNVKHKKYYDSDSVQGRSSYGNFLELPFHRYEMQFVTKKINEEAIKEETKNKKKRR